jgi:hypothetical protein
MCLVNNHGETPILMMVLSNGPRLATILMGQAGVVQWIWQAMCGNGLMIGGQMIIIRTPPPMPLPVQAMARFTLPEAVLGMMNGGGWIHPAGKG